MVADSTPSPSKGSDPAQQSDTRATQAKPQQKAEAQLEPKRREKRESKSGRQAAQQSPQREDTADVTRAGVIWVAISAGLIFFVLLIIFILQNQDPVTVKYFGAVGELPLGMALFIAAVGGGILVAVAGAIRIMQLRKQRRRQRARVQSPQAAPPAGTATSTDKSGK